MVTVEVRYRVLLDRVELALVVTAAASLDDVADSSGRVTVTVTWTLLVTVTSVVQMVPEAALK